MVYPLDKLGGKCHEGIYVSEVAPKFRCSFVYPRIWIQVPGQLSVRQVECSVVSRENYKDEVGMIRENL